MILIGKEYNKILIASFCAAVTAAVISNYLLYGTAILMFVIIMLSTSRRFVIALFLISLMTIAGSVGEQVRFIVQLTSLGSLLFLFFKEYGSRFRFYKQIPKIIVYYFLYFISVMLLTTFLSNYPIEGLKLFTLTAIFLGLVYICYSFLNSEKDVNSLISVLVISALIITITVIIDYAKSGDQLINIMTNTYNRSSGNITNVNAVGGLIANVIPLVLSFLFYSKFNKQKKYLVLLILFLLFLGVLLTSSRAAYVSIFISTLIILYAIRKEILKWFAAVILVATIAVLYYEPLNTMIQLLLRIDRGLSDREVFWDLSVNIVKENFWLGIGPGAYKYEVYNYLPVILESWYGKLVSELMDVAGGSNSSHNFYLMFFSDMGFLGLIASILIPVVFYIICIPVLKYFRNKNEFNYLLALSIVSMGTGLFIRSFFMEIGILRYGFITTDLSFWLFFIIIIHLYKDHIMVK